MRKTGGGSVEFVPDPFSEKVKSIVPHQINPLENAHDDDAPDDESCGFYILRPKPSADHSAADILNASISSTSSSGLCPEPYSQLPATKMLVTGSGVQRKRSGEADLRELLLHEKLAELKEKKVMRHEEMTMKRAEHALKVQYYKLKLKQSEESESIDQ